MEGTVAICVGGEVVEVAGPGSLLGEMALINSSVRSATVVTRLDCRFISINSSQFDLLVRESPEFARHVMEVMADRLRNMNQRFKDVALGERPVPGRSSAQPARPVSAKENIVAPVLFRLTYPGRRYKRKAPR